MPYRRKPVNKRRNKKRWYLDATIGRNVPIIGGTGLRMGTQRAVQRQVKRQLLKTEETKKLVTQLPQWTMAQGTIYTVQLNNIPQGTTSSSRVGDAVFYCGFNVKFQVNQVVPNAIWRFYIIRHRESYGSPVQGTWGTGIGSSLMFRGNDVTPTSYLNSDDVTVVCAKTLKVDAKFTGEQPVREFRMNCRVMKNFQFRTNSQFDGEYSNYYLVGIPYAVTIGGTYVIGTTNIGSVNANIEQVYKDA